MGRPKKDLSPLQKIESGQTPYPEGKSQTQFGPYDLEKDKQVLGMMISVNGFPIRLFQLLQKLEPLKGR